MAHATSRLPVLLHELQVADQCAGALDGQAISILRCRVVRRCNRAVGRVSGTVVRATLAHLARSEARLTPRRRLGLNDIPSKNHRPVRDLPGSTEKRRR